jgi:acyl dehydratase
MPINHDAAGATGQLTQISWSPKDGLLYALGVGAGTEELAFTTENSIDVPQRILPTLGVVLGIPGAGTISAIGTFNLANLVHGEQGITLHREIPTSGSINVQGRVTGIYDKGSGAVATLESDCTDAATGEPLFSTTTSVFIKGEGGWGGERGPSGSRNAPPDRPADKSVSERTRPEQALIYRLSGDRNPLHSDPRFAATAGFDRPILHGLCTFGFAGRALLHTLCQSDPARFRSMEGRFASPVFPGEELTTEMWIAAPGECVFQTKGEDGRIVLAGGRHAFTP